MPLPLTTRLSATVARITHNPDPLTRVANLLALILAWNTPVYPLYVIAACGARLWPWMPIHLIVLPIFAAIPLITRSSAQRGRILLVAAGTLNTTLCMWLYGPAAGMQLFLLPCITLAIMLFHPAERRMMLLLPALPSAAYFLLGHMGASPLALTAAQSQRLLGINAISVGILTIFLAWTFANTATEPTPSTQQRTP